MNDQAHVDTFLSRQSNEVTKNYKTCLQYSIDVIHLCICQGFDFCGHEETKESYNKGNLTKYFKFLASRNEEINKVVLKNAPLNVKLNSPSTQKHMINSIAHLIVEEIKNDFGDDIFTILVDVSWTINQRKNMVVVIHYMNRFGLE